VNGTIEYNTSIVCIASISYDTIISVIPCGTTIKDNKYVNMNDYKDTIISV
jgi:hypothetical protein